MTSTELAEVGPIEEDNIPWQHQEITEGSSILMAALLDMILAEELDDILLPLLRQNDLDGFVSAMLSDRIECFR